jgi:uncharacterized membrane-anchored protein YjiN (DUF445 family)
MRLIAGSLLLAMAGLLAIAALLRPRYPALSWLEAFAEAGLVGGLADWFAVVALFRHPLGLPFPHTAILPRNKDRIGRELGLFVEQNFLTPENILARLDRVDLAGRAARWLAQPANAASVAATITDIIPRIVGAVDDKAVEQMIAHSVASRIDKLDAASFSGDLLAALTRDGRHQEALDQVLTALGSWLDEHRATIQARFGSQSRLTPKWVDSYVVNRFVGAIVDLIDEVVAADRHALRDSFDRYVEGFIERLRTDPALRDKAERLKQDLLRHLALERFVGMVWSEVKKRLIDDPSGAIKVQITAAIVDFARQARQDPALLERINHVTRSIIESALGRFRRQVSSLISDVVQRWNPQQVSANIEREVGRDLQYIRLNGTVVGGLAGLALHAALVLAGLL